MFTHLLAFRFVLRKLLREIYPALAAEPSPAMAANCVCLWFGAEQVV